MEEKAKKWCEEQGFEFIGISFENFRYRTPGQKPTEFHSSPLKRFNDGKEA